MESDQQRIERLRQLLASAQPDDLPKFLTSGLGTRPLIAGTGVPFLAPRGRIVKLAGLDFYVPASALESPKIPEGSAAYVSFQDYVPSPMQSVPPLLAVNIFIEAMPQIRMIQALAALNSIAHNADALSQYTAWFCEKIAMTGNDRLKLIMDNQQPDTPRVLISRQIVLASLRQVFVHSYSDRALSADATAEHSRVSPEDLYWATLLCHAVADLIGPEDRSQPTIENLVERRPDLVMEIVQNQFFYHPTDYYSAIYRYNQIWEHHGKEIVKVEAIRDAPRDLLREATGLEPLDVLAIALGLMAHAARWNLTEPIWLQSDLHSRLPHQLQTTYVETFTLSFEQFQDRLRDQASNWDFLVFQRYPVLLHEGELLVIDQSLALDRALVGMQFAVNDQERNRKSTPDWGNWKNAWGGMIESYAESWISEMPMTLLTGTSVFLEEDLCQAYPSSEVCDAIIRSDSTFVLFEVCSSRLTIKTTAHGSVDAFEIDTERVIHDKVSQLHATARNIINNEPALTGQTPTPDVAIRPVLVLANPFPLNPIIKNEFIDKPIQALHFLSGPGVHKLAIIDLEELEMLVGFHEQGHSMVEIIGRWQDSELRDWPLRNYVASQRALKKKVERPERIRISTESIFDGLATRLGFDISDYRSEQA